MKTICAFIGIICGLLMFQTAGYSLPGGAKTDEKLVQFQDDVSEFSVNVVDNYETVYADETQSENKDCEKTVTLFAAEIPPGISAPKPFPRYSAGNHFYSTQKKSVKSKAHKRQKRFRHTKKQ